MPVSESTPQPGALPEPNGSAEVPENSAPPAPVPMPFPGFKHLAGLLSGLAASLFGLAVHAADPKLPALAVAICVLGTANAYLLSLVTRSLGARIVATVGGGLLGILSFAAMHWAVNEGTSSASMISQVTIPILFLAFCPLLGLGPLMLVMPFMERHQSGVVIRLLLGLFGAGMAAMIAVVIYGILDSVAAELSPYIGLPLAFVASNYVLFSAQLKALLENPLPPQTVAGTNEANSIQSGEAQSSSRDDEP